MTDNVFLFIIWNNAYHKRDAIISDLKERFDILKKVEINWTPDLFADNLSRFYGKKLPKNSFKEKACGIGPFTLLIIRDNDPVYEDRLTTRGDMERVNINTFDKKTLYRSWTVLPTGNNCIHGTNTPEETDHDICLLLGLGTEDVLRSLDEIPEVYNRDLIGAENWESPEKLFYVMDHCGNYVFLRNFEGMPDALYREGHDDIDLLVEDRDNMCRIMNVKPVFRYAYRSQYVCEAGGMRMQFDLRFAGDGYYDEKWQKRILEGRIFKDGVYIPDEEEYRYMLLYHALIHKTAVADDYVVRLDEMFGKDKWSRDVLMGFLRARGYAVTEPVDLSVFYNTENAMQKESTGRWFKRKCRNVRIRLFNDRG